VVLGHPAHRAKDASTDTSGGASSVNVGVKRSDGTRQAASANLHMVDPTTTINS
jgi:hypothetical protein